VTDQSELLQRLRAANPVPVDDAGASSTPTAIALLDRILAEEPGRALPPPVRAPRARRWRLRLLVPVLAAAGAAGAVGYAMSNRSVTRPETVACFQRADLNARTQIVAPDARGPVAACTEVWAGGSFGATAVPPLAVCILPSGTAGVFPTDPGADPCARLGLVPAPTTAPPAPAPAPGPGAAPPPTVGAATTAGVDENARFLAFRDAVLPQFVDATCVDPAAAQATVRRELDRAGLGDWTVRAGQGAGDGFTPDRPCATLSFRPAERAVLLVPAPPRR
jgi:hypothetical protein